MNATLDNTVNQERETQREPDGNMLNSDDQRRSTGIVPLCTGMPTRCKTSATLRQRHRTCRRNESAPVQCELFDHLLVDLEVTGKKVDCTNGGVVRVPIHTHAVEHEVKSPEKEGAVQ